jgi:hypothetical protein
MAGPLLLHHKKPHPSQATAVHGKSVADGGGYGWPPGPQGRWAAWRTNSLARSSTPRYRNRDVPNIYDWAPSSRIRPLNTRRSHVWVMIRARRGGCGSKKKSRSHPNAADGAVVQIPKRNFLFDFEQPPCLAVKGASRYFLTARSAPPGPAWPCGAQCASLSRFGSWGKVSPA